MKVVSIFGNTGDGKSHTLNHTFFDGKEVFATSSSQLSCTVGVWAAYDDVNRAIVLDTEGLLGVSGNQNQRTRLLLKVLAYQTLLSTERELKDFIQTCLLSLGMPQMHI